MSLPLHFKTSSPIIEDMVSMYPQNPIGRQMPGFIHPGSSRHYNFLPYLTDVTEKAQRQVFHYLNDEGMPVGVRDRENAWVTSYPPYVHAKPVPIHAFISANEIQLKWDSNVSCPIKNNRPRFNK